MMELREGENKKICTVNLEYCFSDGFFLEIVLRLKILIDDGCTMAGNFFFYLYRRLRSRFPDG